MPVPELISWSVNQLYVQRRADDIAQRVVRRLDAAGFATQVVTGSTSKRGSLLALISHVIT